MALSAVAVRATLSASLIVTVASLTDTLLESVTKAAVACAAAGDRSSIRHDGASGRTTDMLQRRCSRAVASSSLIVTVASLTETLVALVTKAAVASAVPVSQRRGHRDCTSGRTTDGTQCRCSQSCCIVITDRDGGITHIDLA